MLVRGEVVIGEIVAGDFFGDAFLPLLLALAFALSAMTNKANLYVNNKDTETRARTNRAR